MREQGFFIFFASAFPSVYRGWAA